MSGFALPEGWRREEVKRSKGLSSGMVDIFYVSPTGQRVRSKLQLAKLLGPAYDLSTFDYRTGKINPSLLRKSNKRSAARTGTYDYRSLRNDPSLTPPSRQTSSIIKQSVNVIRTQPESIALNANQIREYFKRKSPPFDLKLLDAGEKPFQVLWCKRLDGKRASSIDAGQMASITLPPTMKPFCATLSDQDSMLRSLTAALYHGSHTVRGQERNLLERKRKSTESPRDPTAFVNPHQPIIQATTLSEEDIRRQEDIVRKHRSKLREVMGMNVKLTA